MASVNNNQSNGVGFLGLLTIAFIVLKLTHFINWSWWWVLAPAWIPTLLVAIVLIVIGGIFLIGYLSKHT